MCPFVSKTVDWKFTSQTNCTKFAHNKCSLTVRPLLWASMRSSLLEMHHGKLNIWMSHLHLYPSFLQVKLYFFNVGTLKRCSFIVFTTFNHYIFLVHIIVINWQIAEQFFLHLKSISINQWEGNSIFVAGQSCPPNVILLDACQQWWQNKAFSIEMAYPTIAERIPQLAFMWSVW